MVKVKSNIGEILVVLFQVLKRKYGICNVKNALALGKKSKFVLNAKTVTTGLRYRYPENGACLGGVKLRKKANAINVMVQVTFLEVMMCQKHNNHVTAIASLLGADYFIGFTKLIWI